MTVVRCCVAALAAVAVAGCGAASESLPKPSIQTGGSGPLWTPPAESSSPAPSPEPSATFGPEQLEAAQTVEKFFEVLHKVETNPEVPLEELTVITTGRTQSVFANSVAEDRNSGLVATGSFDVYITGAGETKDEAQGKTVRVDACTDATNNDLVRQDTGESVLDSGRPRFVHWKIDVIYFDNFGWVVGDLVSDVGSKCKS